MASPIPASYSYTYDDIGRVCLQTRNTVQQAHSRKIFNVENLGSAVLYCVRHGSPDFKALVTQALYQYELIPEADRLHPVLNQVTPKASNEVTRRGRPPLKKKKAAKKA